jgi:hypothetical protein
VLFDRVVRLVTSFCPLRTSQKSESKSNLFRFLCLPTTSSKHRKVACSPPLSIKWAIDKKHALLLKSCTFLTTSHTLTKGEIIFSKFPIYVFGEKRPKSDEHDDDDADDDGEDEVERF